MQSNPLSMSGGVQVWARPVRSVPPPGPLEWTGVSVAGAWGQFLLLVTVVVAGHWLWTLVIPSPMFVTRAELNRALLISKIGEGLTVILLTWLLARVNGLSWRQLGLTAERLPQQCGWGLLALGGAYLMLLVSVMLALMGLLWFQTLTGREVFPDIAERRRIFQILPLNDVRWSLLLLIPVVIHEELAFRALLMPLLRRMGAPWWLVILSASLLFGLMHLSYGWLAVVQIGLGVGLALGTAYALTRSLLVVLIAHFLFNFLQFQLIRLLL